MWPSQVLSAVGAGMARARDAIIDLVAVDQPAVSAKPAAAAAWYCSCEQRNKGKRKRCVNCGLPSPNKAACSGRGNEPIVIFGDNRDGASARCSFSGGSGDGGGSSSSSSSSSSGSSSGESHGKRRVRPTEAELPTSSGDSGASSSGRSSKYGPEPISRALRQLQDFNQAAAADPFPSAVGALTSGRGKRTPRAATHSSSTSASSTARLPPQQPQQQQQQQQQQQRRLQPARASLVLKPEKEMKKETKKPGLPPKKRSPRKPKPLLQQGKGVKRKPPPKRKATAGVESAHKVQKGTCTKLARQRQHAADKGKHTADDLVPMCPWCRGRIFAHDRAMVLHLLGEERSCLCAEQRKGAGVGAGGGCCWLSSVAVAGGSRVRSALLEQLEDESSPDDSDEGGSGDEGGSAAAKAQGASSAPPQPAQGQQDDPLQEDHSSRTAACAMEWVVAGPPSAGGMGHAIGADMQMLLVDAAPDSVVSAPLRLARQDALLHRIGVAPALPWRAANGWHPPSFRWLVKLGGAAAVQLQPQPQPPPLPQQQEALSQQQGATAGMHRAGLLFVYSVRLVRASEAHRPHSARSYTLMELLWRTLQPAEAHTACRAVAAMTCNLWQCHGVAGFLCSETPAQSWCMDVCNAASDLVSMVADEEERRGGDDDLLGVLAQIEAKSFNSGLGTGKASRERDAYLRRRFCSSLDNARLRKNCGVAPGGKARDTQR